LVEIPRRLNEHAERVGDEADQQHLQLQQLELDALQASGVKTIEDELESLRLKLDAQDDTIEALETKLNECLALRTAFIAGEDEYIKRCIERISTSLEGLRRWLR